MARVKGASSRVRKLKVKSRAKGFRGAKRKLWKTAKEAVRRALTYSYRDRKVRQRNFRSLWIARINAASRMRDMGYSEFMGGLKKAGVEVNRKILSDIAIHEPEIFDQFVEIARKHCPQNKSGASKT